MITRPWGSFTVLASREGFTVKLLDVLPNQRMSLQYHKQRDETLILLSGEADVIVGSTGGSFKILKPTQPVCIQAMTVHRIAAGKQGAKVIEVSTGQYSEADIVRLEDDYGRANG